MKLACIIMASGASSRFGANKLLADLAGKPLFRWALDAVPAGVFFRVIVVTGYAEIARAARARGFTVVENDRPQDGVSRTVRLGVQASEDCTGALFMTADQPLLTGDILTGLARAFEAAPAQIVAASHDGRRGNPCLFPAELFPELAALEGDTGGAAVIRRWPGRLKLVEVPEDALLDCDTPQSLELCRKKAEKNQ